MSTPSSVAQITVIVSVYNGAAYLAQTLDSILAQSFPHFILLLIDDASTDATPAIIADYTRKDRRVRALYNAHNIGVAASRNAGMDVCDTPYIAPMDADDLVTPDWLAKKYAVMEARPDIATLGNALHMMGHDGTLLGRVWSPPATPQGIRNALFTRGMGIPHTSSLLRTDILRRLGGYREMFAAALDLDLWLRMTEHYDIACLPDILLYYRQHSASISQSKAATQTYNHILAMISSERRRQGRPDPIAGQDLTCDLLCSLLQSSTQSALVWFTLLSQRDVPDKEKHLHRACIMAYERPCTAAFLRQQLPVWRSFTSHFPQCMQDIVTAARHGTPALWKANVCRIHAEAAIPGTLKQ